MSREDEVILDGAQMPSQPIDLERAIHKLFGSALPAISFLKVWDVRAFPLEFEHLDYYREMAKVSGLYIRHVSYPRAGGDEHQLVLLRDNSLSDSDVLRIVHGGVEDTK